MSIMNAFSLKGKVALVTGGAGLYGKQIVQALAEAGAKTYMTSRDASKLPQLEQQFRDLGCEVTALQLDQGDEASILALKDRILADNNGQFDILVNNAVIRTMSTYQDPAKALSESMHVNMTGLHLITRAFADVMKEHNSGSIINIGSMYGMVGPDFAMYEGMNMNPSPDYYMHKGAMINYTRYLASVYGNNNIRANCISPGGLRSERNTQEFADRYGKRTFLGRMANDTDLMGIIVFLASEASLYVTGTNIPVDGGYTAK